MRLVKFNVITVASSEKGDFSGMPIPNAAALVCSYLLITRSLDKKFNFSFAFYNREVFIGIAILTAILMVSTIRFKTPEKTFFFIPKKVSLIVIIVAIATIYYSIFLLSFSYILINLFYHIRSRFGAVNSDDSPEEVDVPHTQAMEYLPLIIKDAEPLSAKEVANKETSSKKIVNDRKKTKSSEGELKNSKSTKKKPVRKTK
jgi:CDP-diacylglycerol--serine O-phosphatidyltransferase